MSRKAKLPRGIRRRGNSFVACFKMADGKIERRTVSEGGTLQEALEQRAVWTAQVRAGTYQKKQSLLIQAPVFYTVADLWAIYLVDYKNRSDKDSSRLIIGWNHLKDRFAKMRVQDVTTAEINKYIAGRRGEGMSNGTINREVALLRAMFNLGTKQTPIMVDRIPAFPTRLIEPPPRKGFVRDKEYAVLAANAKDLWLRALIAAAYSFGFRKGELLNLRVRQVDLLERLIQLEEGSTKNDEARKVYMTEEVFQLLQECVRGKKPNDFVFTRDGGGRVVDPREEWYSLCVSSGLGQWIPAKRKNGEEFKAYRGLNLHDFRRSAIRNMTRRGVNDTTAMKISGHKTRSVFMRYNIVDERDLAEAARKIEAGREVGYNGPRSDTKVTHERVAHS